MLSLSGNLPRDWASALEVWCQQGLASSGSRRSAIQTECIAQRLKGRKLGGGSITVASTGILDASQGWSGFD